jgi:hypothetical protein
MTKQNNILIAIILIVIAGGGGFWSGMHYQTGKRPSFTGANGNFAGSTNAGNRFARGGAAGGVLFGTIIAKDAAGVTVKIGAQPGATSTDAASGSRIVLISDATQIMKTESGSANDLSIGQSISVTGSANSDGSLNAQMIQLRPAGGR